MRSRKALINTIVAIVLEIVTMISGIIIPRLIIGRFGSELNGLLTSIAQFLAYLTLLESGVGGVVKAALYKPLAFKDTAQISAVVKATELFFRKIAIVSVIYILGLSIVLPLVLTSSYNFSLIAALVLIIGANNIAQYYFGITYQLVIRADQRGYIYSIIQIISTIANIVVTYCMISIGCNIQIVKLVSGLVFVARPILLNIYVSRRYNINKKAEPDDTSLSQRWNGVGFSVASFVHKKTDVFLITLMVSLKEVSVYSVYSTIATGLDSVVSMTTNSFQAAFGNMIAKNERESLIANFRVYNLIVHILTFTLFPVAMVLIKAYVGLYVHGVDDVNYIRPTFGFLLLLGEAVFCLRQPYQAIVTAAGHYKQTQKGAFIEAGLNIVISIILIFHWGIEGVAVGTLLSMLYRTFDYVIYLSNNIVKMKITYFLKRCVVGILFSAIGIGLSVLLGFSKANGWGQWILNGFGTGVIIFAVNLLGNFLFYKGDMKAFLDTLFRALGKRRKING